MLSFEIPGEVHPKLCKIVYIIIEIVDGGLWCNAIEHVCTIYIQIIEHIPRASKN